jgi:hypothetical protein
MDKLFTHDAPPPAYSQVPSALASLETMSSLGMQERR